MNVKRFMACGASLALVLFLSMAAGCVFDSPASSNPEAGDDTPPAGTVWVQFNVSTPTGGGGYVPLFRRG